MLLVPTHQLSLSQDNADIEWKFARAVIIRNIWKSPPIPIPINIFHFVALLASDVCCTSFKVMRCIVDGRLAQWGISYHINLSLAFF